MKDEPYAVDSPDEADAIIKELSTLSIAMRRNGTDAGSFYIDAETVGRLMFFAMSARREINDCVERLNELHAKLNAKSEPAQPRANA